MAVGHPVSASSRPPRELPTIADIAAWRAEVHGDAIAFTFLADGEADEQNLTYAALDQRARAVAARLQSLKMRGQRALLTFDPGLDYLIALYGCLYAGVTAVPAYPPDPFRLQRTLPRLQAILRDADARLVFGTRDVLAWAGEPLAGMDEVNVLSLDEVSLDEAAHWRPLGMTGEDLAFLQYTSGSTAEPKGVMITHSNVLHNVAGVHDRLDEEGVVGVCWVPPYHDMGLVGAILQPVYSGRPNVLMSPLHFVQRPLRWLQAISHYRATTSPGPNFAFDLCVQKIRPEECQGLDLSSWIIAFNGAEPIRSDTIARFSEHFAPFGFRREAFYPCYGLAESTLMVTGGMKYAAPVVRQFDPVALQENVAQAAGAGGRTLVGCGISLDGLDVRIVDPQSRRALAPGNLGEIWVRGASVAEGYWNRPDETRATFQAQLAGSNAAEPRFLRTGDIGFLDEDRELFVTGRIKELIIIAGRNYYPHDIEQIVERAHPGLKRHGGACFAVDDQGRDALVVVHEVQRPKRYDLAEIAAAVRRELAAELDLTPAAVLLIANGSLPKTSSGKTQRRECLELYLRGDLRPLFASETGTQRAGNAAEGEPQTAMEKQLAPLWCEALGLVRVGRNDDFFALGGQSLRAIEVAAKTSTVVGCDVPLAALLSHPTLAEFAQAVGALTSSHKKNGHQAVSGNGRIAKHNAAHKGAAVNGHAASGAHDQYPLSFSQEALWFLEQLQPGTALANVALSAAIEGDVDSVALRGAFARLIARHDALRARFSHRDGQPIQTIANEPMLDWQFVDLFTQRASPAERATAWTQQKLEAGRQAFDLLNGPLARVRLARLGENRYALAIVVHHIACDGRSLEVLLAELAAEYEAVCENRLSASKAPPLRNVDFAEQQRDSWESGDLATGLDYWRKKLAGAPSYLDLPYDHSRGAAGTIAPSTSGRKLCAAKRHAIEALARSQSTTPFSVFLAAFQSLLARYTSADDICIGTPASLRSSQELHSLVGCLINPIVLRGSTSGDPKFVDMLRAARQTCFEAIAHADVPFERLVDELSPARDSGMPPWAHVMLVYQDDRPQRIEVAAGLNVTQVNVDYTGLAAFELALVARPVAGGLELSLAYDRNVFEPAAIDAMLDALEATLDRVTVDAQLRLSELPIPSAAERNRLLCQWNDTAVDLAPVAGPEVLVAAQAVRTPAAVAIDYAGRQLSYYELDTRANRLAHYLIRRGAGRGQRVGLKLRRSELLPVAMLAVWKAGAAYVPLDPDYPTARLDAMIADARPCLILTDDACDPAATNGSSKASSGSSDSLCVSLPSLAAALRKLPLESPQITATADDPAYVIYTSGSTGRPKGVVVPRGAAVNFLHSMAKEPGLAAGDTLLAVTTVSFDIAVLELFVPLIVGARVAIAPREIVADGTALAQLVRDTGATVMQATPATFRMLLTSGWKPDCIAKLLCGGEALDPPLAARLLSHGTELWNMYGPTETTVWSAVHRVTQADLRDTASHVAIGRPIANTQLYVLDPERRLVPTGAAGELFIGGDGVTLGYWQRDELTAERFVADPFGLQGRRMYRTGDRARWRHDGVLEFMGRLDSQLKIRGFRVEPGEIETLLASHPSVAEAAVVAIDDTSGEKQLVAFYVPAASEGDVSAHNGHANHRNGHASNGHAAGDTNGTCHAPAVDTLRQFLHAELPDYMVPGRLVARPSIPRTPAGKIDRQALAALGRDDLVGPVEYVAPRTDLEQAIAHQWCEVLRLDRVGIHDHFFHLGGHSLLATQLAARLRQNLNVELPLRDLFDCPTIAALAERIVVRMARREDEASVSRMLDNLEAMTDDQVEQLLQAPPVSPNSI